MIEREVVELRARVAKLERIVAFLQTQLGLPYQDVIPTGASPAVLALVRSGDKISAIKQYREETGAALKEAKDLIDSLG